VKEKDSAREGVVGEDDCEDLTEQQAGARRRQVRRYTPGHPLALVGRFALEPALSLRDPRKKTA
jgi:hypothetical protein